MNTIVADRVPDAPARAPRWLLIAGLAAGAALAALGLRVAPGELPPEAVARVNDRLILRDAWLRAVASVASERRAALTEADQRHILERLVDEELLVQHGEQLGLVESDARLRSTLVSEVMAAARTDGNAPDDAVLRAFYDANRDFFAPAAKVRVQAWRLGADGNRQPFQPAPPDALLPLAKLRTYIGPALAQAARALPVGQDSAAIETGAGRAVLRVLESQPGVAPPFEQVRDLVRGEMRRRADEASVRALLAQLRETSQVVVAP
jgi:hypothetical protein